MSDKPHARGPEVPLADTQTAADALGHPPERPDAPEPPKHDRAAELAARYRALPESEEKRFIWLSYMLSDGEALVRSIEALPEKMLDDLNAAIGMEEKGI
jgi:hypothetical protein